MVSGRTAARLPCIGVRHRGADRQEPGAPTIDSDIFVVSVDELLEVGEAPVNLTNDPAFIDEDADWSPDVDVLG